jgi:hypothetical protein
MMSHNDVRPGSAEAARGQRSSKRKPLRRILGPVAAGLAVLYFLIDMVFLLVVAPLGRALTRWGIFNALAARLASLGPYQVLSVFLVALIAFEPVKPVGAYLIATGHPGYGLALLIVGEVLKVTILERLFHFSRDKLLMIPVFAWVYSGLAEWWVYLRAQPLWVAIRRYLQAIKAAASRLRPSRRRQ